MVDLNLQKEHPNSLLNYHEELRGANLGDLALERRISYNLRDFERQVFIAERTFTGDGATVAAFRLSPGDFVRARSIRVLAVAIANEATASRVYTTTVSRRVGTFLFNQRAGLNEFQLGSGGLVVGINAHNFTGTNDLVRFVMPFVEVFANKPDGSPADTFDVSSTTFITAANQVTCTVVWETIPDPAKWSNGNPGFVIV